MSSWQGKSRGNILGYRIFVWSIRNLGLDFAYFLLLFVCGYFVFASGKAFRSIFYYFHTRLGLSSFRSVVNIFRNYYLFGQVLVDKTAVLSGGNHNIKFVLEGKEELLRMRDGGIIISGHIGNWEVGGKALDFLQKKINLVVFDAEHQVISKYMSDTLSDRNVSFIKIGDDFSYMLAIKEALANKEIIALHGDRFVDGNQTVILDFLGEPARFPTGPWHIASHFNVPVSYVFAVKESRHQYRFFASPPKPVPSMKNLKTRNETVIEPIREYIAELEKTVRNYPLQWYNYYDFWNTGQ